MAFRGLALSPNALTRHALNAGLDDDACVMLDGAVARVRCISTDPGG